jgi:hypothetical protein
MLQLFLLCCRVVWCLEFHPLTVLLLLVWVRCVYYVIIIIMIGIIIIILIRYDLLILRLLYWCLRWVRYLLRHVLDLLWYTWWVSPVSPGLLVSVRMLVVLLFSHPLLSPRVL